MYENIFNQIRREYEEKQKIAREKLIKKKQELAEKLPEIIEIENKIHTTGLAYSKLILAGKNSSDAEVLSLLEDIEKLKEQKKNLLLSNGYPANYLEPEYSCQACKDTGFINNNGYTEKCSCYKQQLINYLYHQSNMELVKTENFDNFNENYYPDVVDEEKYGIKISPRENIIKIKNRCLRFLQNFDKPEEKNLFFSGPPGVGKTFMASCIAKELLDRGKTVLYQTSPVLFNIINEYKYNFSKDEYYSDVGYRNIFEVELLIIDDLGIEPPTPARYAELLTILNIRQINNLTRPCKTIISTNIGPRQLYEYYTERVASRIIGNFDMLKFAGEDIRLLKRQMRQGDGSLV
ncbi:MAG TPA: ATP-binding protein [Clostridiaceae bacterium]|nr:ATP-binding protein [Clostridiaceae bacterium]